MTPALRRAAFGTAFADRIASEILDACQACGACVDACPMTEPGGLDTSDAPGVVRGVLDLLRGGPSTPDARRWAQVCTGSGKCIPACDYGVNPRFMMYLARATLKRDAAGDAVDAVATAGFSGLARAVRMLSRLQLAPETLARISPASGRRASTATAPEVVFYTGCNLLKTPHIALICLDVLDRLDVRYEVMGGVSHCCGVIQFGAGDFAGSNRVALNSIDKLAAPGAARVLAWCPSCQVHFGEIHLPTYTAATGETPFDFDPFYTFLEERLDDLRPLLRHRVEKRVALNERPGHPAVTRAVKAVLGAIPGLELVELDVPRAGVMSNSLSILPDFKRRLREQEFAAAAAAGVTTLATVYHACHRELVQHSPEVAFEIINAMELVGESMGIVHADLYKQLVLLQDVDAIIAESAESIDEYGLPLDDLRDVVLHDMLMRPASRV
jgi:heterodisulfide reductase subunit D